MTIKILIVDDEPLSRAGMQALIEGRNGDLTVLHAKNGPEALRAIEDDAPHVVFLDIEMPVVSGFDVLLQLEERPFQLVFQTAHAEFALKAFEENACDYLLKPYTDERFYQALDRALARVGQTPDLGKLDQFLAKESRFLAQLVFKVGLKSKVMPVDEIYYFLSEEHVTYAHPAVGNYVCNHSLDFLESKLAPSVFVRIHRNALINRTALKAFTSGPPMTVTMRDERVLTVAKERRAKVRKILGQDR